MKRLIAGALAAGAAYLSFHSAEQMMYDFVELPQHVASAPKAIGTALLNRARGETQPEEGNFTHYTKVALGSESISPIIPVDLSADAVHSAEFGAIALGSLAYVIASRPCKHEREAGR